MWNRAHEAGSGYDFAPADASTLNYYQAALSSKCPASTPPYEAVLVGNGVDSNGGMAGGLATSDPLWHGNALRIHTGPLKNSSFVVPTGLTGSNTTPGAAPAAVASSIATAGIVGTAVASYITSATVPHVLRAAWSVLTGIFE
jgi:hypothetical protein